VLLPDGQAPPQPVVVKAEPEGHPEVLLSVWTGWNDPSSFSIEGLAPGPCLVWAQYSGFGEQGAPVVSAAGARDVRVPLPAPRELLIEVVDARSGAPLEGAEIVVKDMDAGVPWNPNPTDSDGVRSIFVRDGAFELTVAARGFSPTTERLTFAKDAETAQQQRTLHLALKEGRLVKGRVVDEAGQPYRGEVVLVTPPTPWGHQSFPSTRVATSADGSFVFDSAPAEGGLLGVLRTPRRDEVFEDSVAEARDGMTIVIKKH